jgi:hypothetical protein
MIETLFSPPHRATAEEIKALGLRYGDESLESVRTRLETYGLDARLTAIHDLYALRGDRAGMTLTLERISDRVWASELEYRDVYPTIHFSGA